jgi:hypothetical protein
MLYGYDSKSLGTKTTTVMLSEKDSIYKVALGRVQEDWILTSEIRMINPENPAPMKVEEGNCAIVPIVETLPGGEVNYRLTFFVAKKDFAPIGNQVNGFFIRVANGDAIASLVINPERLHSVHCSNLLLAIGTLARSTGYMKTDAQRDSKWKENYHFSGIVDVVFEPSDLDILVNDKYKVQMMMYHGVVIDDQLRNSPEFYVKKTRGYAYIATEYRENAEPMINRYYVVPGNGLVYLSCDTQTEHPLHTYSKEDLYIYGKAQREGR